MSSAILKYTSKLNTNLQNIKKRIGEISKKSGEEKNRAILNFANVTFLNLFIIY